MRHFMLDVWTWTKENHAKPFKMIRFEQDHFPTEKECWHWFCKDDDVKYQMAKGIEINFSGLREYND